MEETEVVQLQKLSTHPTIPGKFRFWLLVLKQAFEFISNNNEAKSGNFCRYEASQYQHVCNFSKPTASTKALFSFASFFPWRNQCTREASWNRSLNFLTPNNPTAVHIIYSSCHEQCSYSSAPHRMAITTSYIPLLM